MNDGSPFEPCERLPKSRWSGRSGNPGIPSQFGHRLLFDPKTPAAANSSAPRHGPLSDSRPEAMLAGRIVNERIAFKAGYKTIFSVRARLLSIAYGGLLGNLSSENSAALGWRDHPVVAPGRGRRGSAEGNSHGIRLLPSRNAGRRPMVSRPLRHSDEHWRLNLPGDYAEFLKRPVA